MIKKTAVYLFVSSGFFVGSFLAFQQIYDSQFYKANFSKFLADSGRVLGETASATSSSDNTCTVNQAGLLSACVDSELPKIDRIFLPEKKDTAVDLETCAMSGVAIDLDNQTILYNKNGDLVQPIASLSKLMTALVFLEHNPGWETSYVMKSEDRREGGKIYLFTGDEVTIKDLFHLSLVASDNTATIALVNSTGLTQEEFVKKMNEKAQELDLKNTAFVEPVGLSEKNVSTALEIAKLSVSALSNQEISEATMESEYKFSTAQGKKIAVSSTDLLLKNLPPNGLRVKGGKTGYTESAGYCFVGRFANHEDREVIAVALDCSNYQSRFDEAKKIAEWAFDNYIWR